jgi:Ca2+-binding EF-hand superfamily protein
MTFYVTLGHWPTINPRPNKNQEWSDMAGTIVKEIDESQIAYFWNTHAIKCSLDDAALLIHQYDESGNGLLSFNEFLSLVLPATNATLREMALARDNSGNVHKSQFLAETLQDALALVLLRELDYQKSIEQIKSDLAGRRDFNVGKLFTMLDTDDLSNEAIDWYEIRDFVNKHLRLLEEEDLDSIIRRCDNDGDALLSVSEFHNAVSKAKPVRTISKLEEKTHMASRIASALLPHETVIETFDTPHGVHHIEHHSPGNAEYVDHSRISHHSPHEERHVHHSPFKEIHNHSPPKIMHIHHAPREERHVHHSPPKDMHIRHAPREERHMNHSPYEGRSFHHSPPKETHIHHALRKERHMHHSPPKETQINHPLRKERHTHYSPPKEAHIHHAPHEERYVHHSPPKDVHIHHTPHEERHVHYSPPREAHMHHIPNEERHIHHSPPRDAHIHHTSREERHIHHSPMEERYIHHSPPVEIHHPSHEESRIHRSHYERINMNHSSQKEIKIHHSSPRVHHSPPRSHHSPQSYHSPVHDPSHIHNSSHYYSNHYQPSYPVPAYIPPRIEKVTYDPRKPHIRHVYEDNKYEPSTTSWWSSAIEMLPLRKCEEGELAEEFKELVALGQELEFSKQALARRNDFTLNDAFKIFGASRVAWVKGRDIRDTYHTHQIFITLEEANLILSRYDFDRNGELRFNEFIEMFLPKDMNAWDILADRSAANPDGFYYKLGITDPLTKADFIHVLALNAKIETHIDAHDSLNEFKDIKISKNDFARPLANHTLYGTEREVNTLVDRFDKNKPGRETYNQFPNEVTSYSHKDFKL